DYDCVAVAADALEAGNAMQIDQMLRAREPELHHRHQAVAASQRPGLGAQSREQFDRIGHRRRRRMAEWTRDHGSPPFVLEALFLARGRWWEAGWRGSKTQSR